MMQIPRVDVEETRWAVQSGRALLVCAYDERTEAAPDTAGRVASRYAAVRVAAALRPADPFVATALRAAACRAAGPRRRATCRV
jgi:hypothetical protein